MARLRATEPPHVTHTIFSRPLKMAQEILTKKLPLIDFHPPNSGFKAQLTFQRGIDLTIVIIRVIIL